MGKGGSKYVEEDVGTATGRVAPGPDKSTGGA